MKRLLLIAAASGMAISTAAHAQTVYDTSLQNLSTPRGAGVPTTTTNATGTRTTVAGPGGDANRVSGTPTTGQWYQANVGGGGTVGITTDYARSGNGSAFFSTAGGDSKADLQFNIGSIVPLSSLTSVSYDFFRDASSTVDANLAPVLRFDISKNGAFAGSLILENVYQNQTAAPVGTWTTLTANLNSGIFWASNAALGPTFAAADGGQKTLSQWIADNSNAQLGIYGISLGVGSGFNSGIFKGAIDNVSVNFQQAAAVNANFEVAAVPEPTTWAMMLVGFGGIGAAMRRRKNKEATKASFA